MATARVFKTHPDAFIFESLPGAGPTFAPRLLYAFGTQRDRFYSVGALQMYLGIAPVTEHSGKSVWGHWRWACPKFLRQSIVEWAGMSRRYSLWAAAFYMEQRERVYMEQRERGKTHQAASSANGRLCAGNILRSTASLRSSKYLGTGLSSSPPVAVTVFRGGGDN